MKKLFQMTGLFTTLLFVITASLYAATSNGEELYRKHCSSCHGANGQGRKGPALNKEGLLVTTDLQYLINSIKFGRKKLGCPSFKRKINEDDILKISQFIKSWQKGDSLEAPGHQVTPESTQKGEELFALCGGCHGLEGEGAMGPPLLDEGLLKSISDKDLRRTIMYGRPGTPMKGHLEGMGGLIVLSMEEIDQLIAFIRYKEEKLFR